MVEMVLLLVAAMALVIFSTANKPHHWYYLVDNVTINECRKFDNVREAMTILELCRQDGHEVYLKRIKI